VIRYIHVDPERGLCGFLDEHLGKAWCRRRYGACNLLWNYSKRNIWNEVGWNMLLWILYLWFRALQIHFIINNQRVAALSSLIYYSLRDYYTCFGCPLHPSSGVHKTVVAITGTRHVSVWCRFKCSLYLTIVRYV